MKEKVVYYNSDVFNRLLKERKLSLVDYGVLMTMALRINESQLVSDETGDPIGVVGIAALVGLHRKTAARSLKRFVSLELVEERRHGTSKYYAFNPEVVFTAYEED